MKKSIEISINNNNNNCNNKYFQTMQVNGYLVDGSKIRPENQINRLLIQEVNEEVIAINSNVSRLFSETHGSLSLNLTQNSTSLPSLTNKLSRLTLATFDEDGHCIGQMGSWSFSY